MAQAAVRTKHEELLSAAVRLFRERGYHATSMQDLAEAVGVQRGSLYHYIEAKEDLLWEIMDRTISQLLRAVEATTAMPGSAAERLRRAVSAHLEVGAQRPDEMTILHVELKSLTGAHRRHMVTLRDRYQEVFRAVIRRGISAGEFRKVDPKATVFAILGACNWFTQWYRPGGEQDHTAFATAFCDLFMQGLESGPSARARA